MINIAALDVPSNFGVLRGFVVMNTDETALYFFKANDQKFVFRAPLIIKDNHAEMDLFKNQTSKVEGEEADNLWEKYKPEILYKLKIDSRKIINYKKSL